MQLRIFHGWCGRGKQILLMLWVKCFLLKLWSICMETAFQTNEWTSLLTQPSDPVSSTIELFMKVDCFKWENRVLHSKVMVKLILQSHTLWKPAASTLVKVAGVSFKSTACCIFSFSARTDYSFRWSALLAGSDKNPFWIRPLAKNCFPVFHRSSLRGGSMIPQLWSSSRVSRNNLEGRNIGSTWTA